MAETKSVALGLALEAKPNSTVADWDIEEVSLTEIGYYRQGGRSS